MNILLHAISGQSIAEFTSDDLLIQKEQDALRLLEDLFASGAHKIILHQEAIDPIFFDLSSGLAGAVLQKFVTYSIAVAIVGDFTNVTSKSLKAFIYESNRGRHVFFVESVEAALQHLSRD